MSVIHLPDAARVSVAEAKRLLSDAFPREDVVDVYIDAGGEYHCERNANANPQAFYLEHDFADTCEQLGIKPRFKWRPLLTGYRGPQDDELYVITRDELAALAEFFGIAAAIPDPAPALEQAPQAADVTQAAPAMGEAERRLIALRAIGGNVKWWRGAWRITGINNLTAQEKGRPRSSPKTIRLDLIEAAEAEKREGIKPAWCP
jgi:hypothetical protein